ncbi:unnamed protein product [Prunus armeniaca]|uniref:Uncharacterized protein n=1 Tax=Prunus armeniaca TaxID=36596 RepID=A0A6J5WV67_PRUAR|nr:unnamed protein product [Prunus armeniaca]
MEANCLCSSPLPPPPFFSGQSQCPKLGFGHRRSERSTARTAGMAVVAATRDHYGGRSAVDESLIVLRKRIHEMKMVERNYEPPQDWMHWEKQCYASYDEYICNLVGCLQSYLMNTRPSLALSMLLLVTVSVPASTVMILLRFMEVANGALSAVHHLS